MATKSKPKGPTSAKSTVKNLSTKMTTEKAMKFIEDEKKKKLQEGQLLLMSTFEKLKQMGIDFKIVNVIEKNNTIKNDISLSI